MPGLAVSIDVGGTFTDFVLLDLDSGSLVGVHKVPTTPHDPAEAIIAGWQELLGQAHVTSDQVRLAVHATTLITNAIVERRGAKTAVLTTRGFRDVLEIGIEQIYSIYDLLAPFPEPLIPRPLRLEVSERISRDGNVVEPLDEADVRATIEELVEAGIESIAVALIHAYRNPEHERRIRQIVEEICPEITVSISSQVAPLVGEYERTSTTVADAYVKPLLKRYLAHLETQLQIEGYARELFLVLSSGGITTRSAATEFPIRLLESGPAAGAFAASYFGELCGQRDLLSFDMGGTTAKACVIERGAPDIARMLEADRVYRFMPGSGLPIMAPTVNLIETGAGGGSIAHITRLGLVNVGPQSASSDPGPAAYGQGGGDPTVTDANLVLGYLDPDYFLGGRMELDSERARGAIQTHVGGPLGLELIEAAWGIHSIVNENMARAARTHIIERNRDPRCLALVAFGGAGPAHAAMVARILGVSQVIVPFGAGVASALGALAAPRELPLVRSFISRLNDCDWNTVRALFAEMEEDALRAFCRQENEDEPVVTRAYADMRFGGQYHEIRVELPPVEHLGPDSVPEITRRFHDEYNAVYGRVLSGIDVEVLNWHLVATRPTERLQLTARDAKRHADLRQAEKGVRDAYFRQPVAGFQSVTVYDRYALEPGSMFAGPCIIEEPEATIVVPPDTQVEIDRFQNAIIRLESNEVVE